MVTRSRLGEKENRQFRSLFGSLLVFAEWQKRAGRTESRGCGLIGTFRLLRSCLRQNAGGPLAHALASVAREGAIANSARSGLLRLIRDDVKIQHATSARTQRKGALGADYSWGTRLACRTTEDGGTRAPYPTRVCYRTPVDGPGNKAPSYSTTKP